VAREQSQEVEVEDGSAPATVPPEGVEMPEAEELEEALEAAGPTPLP